MGSLNEVSSMSDWEKQQKAVNKSLVAASKKSDSKILKTEANEIVNGKELDGHCRMVNKLVSEGLEMYRDGDFNYKEFVEDLYKALKAIDAYAPKIDSTDDDDSEE